MVNVEITGYNDVRNNRFRGVNRINKLVEDISELTEVVGMFYDCLDNSVCHLFDEGLYAAADYFSELGNKANSLYNEFKLLTGNSGFFDESYKTVMTQLRIMKEAVNDEMFTRDCDYVRSM